MVARYLRRRCSQSIPVIDKTGLTGLYDIDLKWTPDVPFATRLTFQRPIESA